MSHYLSKSRAYKGYPYSVLKPEMLEYLHSKTVEMLHEVVKVLEKNEIRYMIVGGTLLGAVVTGHFFPWDDDVDLCVLDEDYEKMIDCLRRELSDKMFVQCKQTEPNYFHSWIKIRDVNSKVYPPESQYDQNGVWIDIYRLISSKEKDVPYKIVKEHFDYLNRRFSGKVKNRKEKWKRIREHQLIYKLIKEKIKAILSNKNEKRYIIWSASKIVVKPEWCFPLKVYSFENMELPGFCYAEAYLIEHYGDNYKSLPPEEDRRVGINRVEYKGE